jgi:glycosyltransferase involved in cell wall biosynthesis
MKRRTRLLLTIPHLGGGGAERVITQLTRHLDKDSFDVHLALITEDAPGAEALPMWVRVHRLECRRVRYAWFGLFRLIHAERPDIVLSGMAHLNFLLLLLKPFLPRRTRVLVRQNTTANAATGDRFTRFAYRYLYPKANAIVCQSQAMAKDLAENFGITRDKLRVLANPIDVDRSSRKRASLTSGFLWPEGSWPRVISIGRLAHEKGFDLLLGALELVRREYPRVHAIVLGEGPERVSLLGLASKLELHSSVEFSGFCRDTIPYLEGADLFVLASRYEGMPNALLEAAAAGIPLVSTPSSGGVVDLVQDAPGAWLSEATTAESLAEAICKAVGTLAPPPAASLRLEHAFLGPFESGNAVAGYASLFESMVASADAWR